jgi:hypothetical protein
LAGKAHLRPEEHVDPAASSSVALAAAEAQVAQVAQAGQVGQVQTVAGPRRAALALHIQAIPLTMRARRSVYPM